MNVTLSGIEAGKWRYLTTEETNDINKSVLHSVKTEEGSKVSGEEEMD